MLLAPDSMRLSPEDREFELGPRDSDDEDEDDPPSEGGVAHSDDDRYRRSPAAPDPPPPVGKRPLKDPPESRVEPNMPDRVAGASVAALASGLASGGLRGLVPRKSPPLSLLKTSSPREAMSPGCNLESTCSDGGTCHGTITLMVVFVQPASWRHFTLNKPTSGRQRLITLIRVILLLRRNHIRRILSHNTSNFDHLCRSVKTESALHWSRIYGPR